MKNETFLVFARCWCGFRDTFPFEDYDNEHDDEELTRRLLEDCRQWCDGHEDEVLAYMQSIRDGWNRDFARRRICSASPVGYVHSPSPAPTPPPEVRDDDLRAGVLESLEHMLAICGWRGLRPLTGLVTLGESVHGQYDPLFAMPVFLQAEVPSEHVGLAIDVLRSEQEGALSKQPPLVRRPVVLRFGVVSASAFEPAEYLVVKRQIAGATPLPKGTVLSTEFYSSLRVRVQSLLHDVAMAVEHAKAKARPKPVKRPTEEALRQYLEDLEAMESNDRIYVEDVARGYGLVGMTPQEFMAGPFVGRNDRKLQPHQLKRPKDRERSPDGAGLFQANAQNWSVAEVKAAVMGWGRKLGLDLGESKFG